MRGTPELARGHVTFDQTYLAASKLGPYSKLRPYIRVDVAIKIGPGLEGCQIPPTHIALPFSKNLPTMRLPYVQ